MHQFAHIEIPTTDLDRAGAFYGALFGWRFESFYTPDYRLFFAEDGTLAGGLKQIPTMPLLDGFYNYVEVADVDGAAARAAALGGTLVRPKADLPAGMGSFAIIEAPDGYRIGLWMKRG